MRLVPYVYERSVLVREVWDEAGIKPSDISSLADFKAKGTFTDKDRTGASATAIPPIAA